MIFVDSNIWIFLNIETYPEHVPAVEKITQLRKEGFAINVIVASEVYHKLSQLLNRQEANLRMMKILGSADVTFVQTEMDSVKKALSLASSHEIRINDALIAQQALELKSPILTSDVKDFGKVPKLKVFPFIQRS